MMKSVTLDQATLSKLLGQKEQLEVCDESGRKVGIFTPVEDRSLYEGVRIPLSEEELQRREQETESYTTEEVLAHLRSLEKST